MQIALEPIKPINPHTFTFSCCISNEKRRKIRTRRKRRTSFGNPRPPDDQRPLILQLRLRQRNLPITQVCRSFSWTTNALKFPHRFRTAMIDIVNRVAPLRVPLRFKAPSCSFCAFVHCRFKSRALRRVLCSVFVCPQPSANRLHFISRAITRFVGLSINDPLF